MKQELEEKIYSKYPKLFKEVGLPPTQTCMAFGCDHGDGWYDIVAMMCSGIQSHINQARTSAFYVKKYNRALKQAINGNDRNLRYHYQRMKFKEHEVEERVKNDLEKKEFRKQYQEVPTQLVFTQIKEKFGTLRVYSSGGDEYCQGIIQMAEAMSGIICEECGARGQRREGGWIMTLCGKCEIKRKTRTFK